MMRSYKQKPKLATGNLSNSGSKLTLTANLASQSPHAVPRIADSKVYGKLEPLPTKRSSVDVPHNSQHKDRPIDNPLDLLEEKLDKLTSVLENGFAAQNEGFKLLAACLQRGFVAQSEGFQLMNQGTTMLGKTIRHGFGSLVKLQNRIVHPSEVSEEKVPKLDEQQSSIGRLSQTAEQNVMPKSQTKDQGNVGKEGGQAISVNVGVQKSSEDKQVNKDSIKAEVERDKQSKPLFKFVTQQQMGEFRDQQLVPIFGEPIDGYTLPIIFNQDEFTGYAAKWVGQAVNIVLKEAFQGYCSRKMTEAETRVFVCSNLLLNFHALVRKRNLFESEENEYANRLLSTQFVNTLAPTLDYYLMKYPQKSKVFLSNDMNSIIKEMNEASKPEYSMLRRLGIEFQAKHSGSEVDFSREIKQLVNKLIEESKHYLSEFKQLMTEIFTIDPPGVDTPSTVDHLIGMKFKESVPGYDSADMAKSGIPIKSPEVLRVLIKWIEELRSIILNPSTLKKRRTVTKEENENPTIEQKVVKSYVQTLVNNIACSAEDFEEKTNDNAILYSARKRLSAYVQTHQHQFQYLPRSAIEIGLSVHILSLLTEEKAVLYLQQLLAFLTKSQNTVYNKFKSSASNNLLSEVGEVVSFSIFDILRAKCFGTIDEVRKVVKNLTTHKAIKVVRVKNRLNTGNRDFLINFIFGECKLVCEVQVGLKSASGDQDAEQKSVRQDHFNHFLYELRRSQFGPLSESAMIINYQSDIGVYFKEHTKPGKKTEMVKFEVEEEEDEIVVKGYSKFDSEATVLCSNCLELRSSRMFVPWKTYQGNYLCGTCVFHKLNKTQKIHYYLGKNASKFFDTTNKYMEGQEPSPYVVVLDPEARRKPTLYSTFRHKDYRPLDYFSSKEPGFKFILQSYGFKDLYYECGVPLSTFYNLKFFEKQLLFNLKSKMQFIVLNIPPETMTTCSGNLYSHEQIRQWLSSSPENDDLKEMYKDRNLGPFKFHWLFRRQSQHKEPIYEVRCAFDPETFDLIILDFAWPEKRLAQAEVEHTFNRMGRDTEQINKYLWQYQNKQLSEKNFQGFQKDHSVVYVNASGNQFTRVDFLPSTSLAMLNLEYNFIRQLSVPTGFYAMLKELNVASNQIEVLDFTILNLPNLQRLTVSNNPITKIIQTKQSVFSKLQALEINSTLIDSIALGIANFPAFKELTCNGNINLREVDVSGLKSLEQLTTVDDPALTRLALAGEYPNLKALTCMYTRLERLDLRTVDTPNLSKLSLSQNILRFCALSSKEMPTLSHVALDCNFLEEFALPPNELVPMLRHVSLDFNKIKEISWKPTDYQLAQFTRSYNAGLSEQFPEFRSSKESGLDLNFRSWRMFVARQTTVQRLLRLIEENSGDSGEMDELRKILGPMSRMTATSAMLKESAPILEKLQVFVQSKYLREIVDDLDWTRLMSIEVDS